MASELVKMTAEIVMSHASATELSPRELVQEIKEVYGVLASLEEKAKPPEVKPPVKRGRKVRRAKMKKAAEARAVLDKDKAPFEDQDYVEFMADREG